MPLAAGLVGEMSVSVNMEGHSGTCVSAVKELLVFFIKKSPCRKFTVSNTRSGYPCRELTLTETTGGSFCVLDARMLYFEVGMK